MKNKIYRFRCFLENIFNAYISDLVKANIHKHQVMS